jgi:hypothetical protein
MLPSSRQISSAAEKLLVLEDWHRFGPYYDPTLLAWYHTFTANWNRIKHAYDRRFFRFSQKTGQSQSIKKRTPDGRHGHITCAPVFDTNGEMVAVVVDQEKHVRKANRAAMALTPLTFSSQLRIFVLFYLELALFLLVFLSERKIVLGSRE